MTNENVEVKKTNEVVHMGVTIRLSSDFKFGALIEGEGYKYFDSLSRAKSAINKSKEQQAAKKLSKEVFKPFEFADTKYTSWKAKEKIEVYKVTSQEFVKKGRGRYDKAEVFFHFKDGKDNKAKANDRKVFPADKVAEVKKLNDKIFKLDKQINALEKQSNAVEKQMDAMRVEISTLNSANPQLI